MTQARVVAEGLCFGEGPRWHDGRLWFSDFYDHAVKSLGAEGDIRVELRLDDQPSGLGWLPDGRLLVVAMRARTVLRMDSDGMAVHADLGDIAVHMANDMVVSAEGRAYVGNFGFDLDRELESRGVEHVLADHPTARLARVDADGSVHVAAVGLHFPNGSVITPDGRTLIVAETLSACLTAFDIGADGSLSDRRIWASLAGRAPDGICLDEDGNMWVANAVAPECVLVAPGGEVLRVVETNQPCFACMLGGEGGRTLFMLTAPSSVSRIVSQSRDGNILALEVEAGHAGRP